VDTRDEMLVRILDAAARKNKRRDELKQAIFPQVLQSELTLAVGFGTFIVNCNKSVISL